MLPHNVSVLHRAFAVCLAAAGLLAGCATHPPDSGALTPETETVEIVPPEPKLAPPPSAPPVAPPPVAAFPTSPNNNIPPASPPKVTAQLETWVPLDRWCASHGIRPVSHISNLPAPTFVLAASRGNFTFRLASRLAYWNGSQVHLGFAPQVIEGKTFIHRLDLTKTILPLLEPSLVLPERPVAVIDPGHGGSDSGTRSVLGQHFEKEYTLDWAKRVQTLLTAQGWQVLLTRNSDIDISLSNRVAFADAARADLFLSLHFNSAAPSQAEAGLEIYCLTPSGMPSSLTRGAQDDLAVAFPNNAYDTQNLQLALRLQQALLQVNEHHDRGLRRARFPKVLRGQQRPAVLVEGGYLSNPREARLIADSNYRQRLAEAVVAAIRPNGATKVAQSANAHSAYETAASREQSTGPNVKLGQP